MERVEKSDVWASAIVLRIKPFVTVSAPEASYTFADTNVPAGGRSEVKSVKSRFFLFNFFPKFFIKK